MTVYQMMGTPEFRKGDPIYYTRDNRVRLVAGAVRIEDRSECGRYWELQPDHIDLTVMGWDGYREAPPSGV